MRRAGRGAERRWPRSFDIDIDIDIDIGVGLGLGLSVAGQLGIGLAAMVAG